MSRAPRAMAILVLWSAAGCSLVLDFDDGRGDGSADAGIDANTDGGGIDATMDAIADTRPVSDGSMDSGPDIGSDGATPDAPPNCRATCTPAAACEGRAELTPSGTLVMGHPLGLSGVELCLRPCDAGKGLDAGVGECTMMLMDARMLTDTSWEWETTASIDAPDGCYLAELYEDGAGSGMLRSACVVTVP